jgi:hypothetical protein
MVAHTVVKFFFFSINVFMLAVLLTISLFLLKRYSLEIFLVMLLLMVK